MEWSGNAVIGWQASSSYYRNHPLSGTSNARQVACLNTGSSYNTVIFKLSSTSKEYCKGYVSIYKGLNKELCMSCIQKYIFGYLF